MRLSPSHRHSRVTPGNATAILKTFWRGVRSGRPGIKVATAVGNSIAELLDQPAQALTLVKPLLR